MKKGAAHTEQARLKISEKMRGRQKSEATREKMSFAAQVRWAKERQRRKRLGAESVQLEPIEVQVAEPKFASDTYVSELTKPLGE